MPTSYVIGPGESWTLDVIAKTLGTCLVAPPKTYSWRPPGGTDMVDIALHVSRDGATACPPVAGPTANDDTVLDLVLFKCGEQHYPSPRVVTELGFAPKTADGSDDVTVILTSYVPGFAQPGPGGPKYVRKETWPVSYTISGPTLPKTPYY